MIAGRDIRINGSPQQHTAACGSTCSSSAPGNIAHMGGVYAAHEQIQINGNPNIFGVLIAEEAIDCSTSVKAPTEVNGDPQVFFDCDHPPNPWAGEPTHWLSWQEVR